MAHRQRIGDILVQRGVLTQPQLEGAVAHHQRWGVSVGRSAVVRGLCTEEQVIQALSWQLALPLVDLDREEPSPEVSGLIPLKVAEQYRTVALRLTGMRNEVLVVAMAAPADLDAQDVVRAVSLKARLQVMLAGDEAIGRAIGRVYRGERPTWATAPPQPSPLRPEPAPQTPPSDEVTRLGLSAGTSSRLQRSARAHGVTDVELVRRVLDAWAKRSSS